jgi:GTP-binding protein Era
MMNNVNQRCGFVAVIGAPNAGKSTLINALVGTKVTIVSPKVQTTRMNVRGIAMAGSAQVIFIDTPGIFSPKRRLDRAMVAAAWEGQGEGDLSLLLIDSTRTLPDDQNKAIIDKLKERGKGQRVALVLNKVDAIPRDKLVALAQHYNDEYAFDATFMISALKEQGTNDLMKYLEKNMPEGPYHFDPDQVSDLPMRLLAAEITREKLFLNFHQELPYLLTVETESWEQFDNGDVRISQVIYIAREAHKSMIIGRGGQALKRVGEAARHELQDILEQKVHLKLFVKVRENWIDDPERYAVWGLDPQS